MEYNRPTTGKKMGIGLCWKKKEEEEEYNADDDEVEMREPHHASVVEAASLYRCTRKDSITLFFSVIYYIIRCAE